MWNVTNASVLNECYSENIICMSKKCLKLVKGSGVQKSETTCMY